MKHSYSFLLILIITIPQLSGCVTDPEYYETEKSTGRVIARYYHKNVTNDPVKISIPLLINGVFVETGVELRLNTPDVYIYTLRKDDSEIFLTQSSNEYAIGECLRLWHPPSTVDLENKYYFVTGTLQNSTDCE